ncbi:putative serine threonine-protein kinase vps15-like protein [Lasius niger]|uniref:Putative serine threonine-protein kinase vps15-like protein n=1 Tax=Lasius niger TaxID=67767 RepID=A0A0J7K7H0_LASNI|nr:putative serine threonine-protein kinase vps15-like protein [Lasius niger]
MIRQKQQHDRLLTSTSGGLRASFELEVKDAQNISICSYSVESIPDIRGTRMPKDLVHIKCNVIGSKCLNIGDQDIYCCIQTYRYVEVSYSDGEGERLKIYTGCVFALQDLNNGLSLVQSNNPYND